MASVIDAPARCTDRQGSFVTSVCASAAAESLKTAAATIAHASACRDERHDDRRADVGAWTEDDGNGADKGDGERAEHAVHQDRRRRLREPHVVFRQAVRAIRVPADARQKRSHERTHEEGPQDDGERRTRARCQRAEKIDPPPRHQRPIDEDEQDRGAEPADVGLRRRCQDGSRVCAPNDERRQADGNSDAKDAGWTQILCADR